jgi:hypothetical protein
MQIAPHAILRYLERVERVDIEAERRRLRTASVSEISDARLSTLLEQEEPERHARVIAELTAICEPAAAAGATSVKRDGVIYAFKDGALVTVLLASNSRRKLRAMERRLSGASVAGRPA